MPIDIWRPWAAHRNKPENNRITNNSPEYRDAVHKVTDGQTLEEILVKKYPRAGEILYELGSQQLINLGFKSGQIGELTLALKKNSYPITCTLGGESVSFSDIDQIGSYLQNNFGKNKAGRKKKS